MAADEKWYFTKSQLENTPSRKCGLDADKELSYRQQAANFIQDMGQRLKVTQLCINTAIVYMHRFYIFHSFTQFHRNQMAAASLFLAAKVEEQPRKLEHVITVAHWCLYREEPKLDTKSEQYMEQAQELVFNENVLLQTLGFDVAIDHPHTHVVRCCHLVRANKELAQTSYFMASNSLHLTTMCLQYKPTVVACFCIHLACKWSNWEIPQSNEGKDWYTYVDAQVTLELLEQLTAEFLVVYDKCPSRLKKMSGKKDEQYGFNMSSVQLDQEPRRGKPTFGPNIRPSTSGQPTSGSATGSSSLPQTSNRQGSATEDVKKPHHAASRVDYRDYKEKKAREAAAAAAAAAAGGGLNKDIKPHLPLPSHSQQPRPPPSHHQLAKREVMKQREVMVHPKQEVMKQEVKREQNMQRPGEGVNQLISQESRDQKRSRDNTDSGIGGSNNIHHPDPLLQHKRPEALLDHANRRPRDSSEAPPNHHHHHHHHGHHHGDHTRREIPGQRPSPSTHPMHNPMKRPRDNQHELGLIMQPNSQSKRPREGADPLVNMLDPTKRPREPTDSSHMFNVIKSETIHSSSDMPQIDRPHQSIKFTPESKPQPHQLPSLSGFSDNRQGSKSIPPTNSIQRHSSHPRHNRPQESALSKNYDLEQQNRNKPLQDRRDSPLLPKPDPHVLRPSQLMVGKSPTLPVLKSKSPSEFLKSSDSRSRSPLIPTQQEQKVTTPEVSKRMADILSRPSGHLFSPEDDREDSTLPSLAVSPPEIAPLKIEKQSPTLKQSKQRVATPEKNALPPPSFSFQTSPASSSTQGKLAVTPTSDNRKRRRTQSSSSSEPELVPVCRKVEEMPGFHTLIKGGNVAIKLPGRVPDIIQPIPDHNLPPTPGKDSIFKAELTLSDLRTKPSKIDKYSELPNLIEPIPSLIKPMKEVSEQIPQTPNINEPPPTPGAGDSQTRATEEVTSGEHHRKKKKEKHGKKDKDKDRNRDEKKHKHKKKERDKARDEKHSSSEPIKIKISKDKVNIDSKNSSPPKSQESGLKIKIPKERLKVDSPPMASSNSNSTTTSSSVQLGGLKIKIGKELISERRLESSPIDQTSRKRDSSNRSQSSTNQRRNYNKQNGHPDRKVPLKVDSFHPPPGCRQ